MSKCNARRGRREVNCGDYRDKTHLTGEAPIGAAKRGKRCPGPGPPAAQPITALTVEFQTVKYETVSKVLS